MTVQLDSVIEQVGQLPALPATSARIIQIATDPRTGINEILDAIRYDQNITGQVLRLCNSAYYGLSRRIGSLKEALAYLGAMPLLQLILGVHSGTILMQSQPGYGLLEGMLWKHSSAVALAAECLARHTRADKPAALFTCGLLHDIGKVVLSRFLADTYQQVLDLLAEGPITFNEAEKQVLGYTHTEVGQLVANKWQLPEQIAASARYHHSPSEYTGSSQLIREFVELTHLADSLAMTMGIGAGTDGLQYTADPNLWEKYRLGDKVLDKTRIEVLEGVGRLENVYNVRQAQ